MRGLDLFLAILGNIMFWILILIVHSSSAAPNQQKPSYPSSKSKVDWDKLEAQVKKEVSLDTFLPSISWMLVCLLLCCLCFCNYQEKQETLDGDAALNKLLLDIYRDADEDTRRAMSKSFVGYPYHTLHVFHLCPSMFCRGHFIRKTPEIFLCLLYLPFDIYAFVLRRWSLTALYCRPAGKMWV